MEMDQKIERVRSRLRDLGKVAVAFSGGKDSFFLLRLAVEALGKENVIAFFVETILTSTADKERVKYFSNILDFPLKKIPLAFEAENKAIGNPKDRCYFCKRMIFENLLRESKAWGATALLDGTTHSDLQEYRPGLKALRELEIISPLEEAGISSAEIVATLEKSTIEPFYLTSSTCLATRFPYNFALKPETIKRFDEVEYFLAKSGIFPLRVRYIPDGIRIETERRHFQTIIQRQDEIITFCRERGFKFVTLDLAGIKSGSWD